MSTAARVRCSALLHHRVRHPAFSRSLRSRPNRSRSPIPAPLLSAESVLLRAGALTLVSELSFALAEGESLAL
ncbi:MAG TPA: hypothetical protein VFF36_02260, partial [Planctomycetota bacterium]|nr:hypothetical protein [Planctomycetota bacterium]